MSLSCDVTRDLLPLYHDGVCSEESRALVEEHVALCPGCAGLLKELRGELDLPHESPDDLAPLEQIRKNVKKGNKKAWMKGAAAVLSVLLLAFGGMNLWWYTQVYRFYAQFAEGKPQAMVHEYDPDTGEVIASYPVDRSEYQWHTENMNNFHVVQLPDYLQDNGEAALHIMPTWKDNKMSKEGKSVHTSVYMGRGLYTYSVHLTIYETRVVPGNTQLEEIRTEECIMLDEKLNQVYLEHWDSDFRLRQDILLQEYQDQIMAVVKAAQSEWPFLTGE